MEEPSAVDTQAARTPATIALDEGAELALEARARASTWNQVQALNPDELEALYLRWRGGQVSSTWVADNYGPAIVEALQAEHLIYMNGEEFFKAQRAAATEMDHASDTDGKNRGSLTCSGLSA